MAMSKKEVKIIALIGLDTVFFLIEIIIGYMVNSLALIADSFHMLNDILSLFVALWAVNVAKNRVADAKYTYGWQRAEILGALVNGVFLVALCVTIFIEALQRFISPPVIDNPQLILIVGFLGLASNLVGLLLFHEGDGEHGHGHSHGGSMDLGAEPAEELDEDDLEAQEAAVENAVHSHSHSSDAATANTSVPPPRAGEPSPSLAMSGSYGATKNATATPGAAAAAASTLQNGSDDSDIENILPAVVVNRIGNYGKNDSSDSASTPDNTVATTGSGSGPAADGANGLLRRRHRKHKKVKSLNMQGVFLHVMGDCLGNVGVILTAVLIWKTDLWWKYYFDPAVSVMITAIIFSTAWPLCKSSGRILLQGTPVTIDSEEVISEIIEIPEVISVHDFHIWNLTETYMIASMHADLNCSPDKFLSVASQIKIVLHDFGVHSATVQPEFSTYYANEHMLPKRYSSQLNLPKSNSAYSLAPEDESTPLVSPTSAHSHSHTHAQIPSLAGQGSASGPAGQRTDVGDIHCLVDASANCSTNDCSVPEQSHTHSHAH